MSGDVSAGLEFVECDRLMTHRRDDHDSGNVTDDAGNCSAIHVSLLLFVYWILYILWT